MDYKSTRFYLNEAKSAIQMAIMCCGSMESTMEDNEEYKFLLHELYSIKHQIDTCDYKQDKVSDVFEELIRQ